MQIEIVDTVDEQLHASLVRLIAQLSSSRPALEDLRAVVASEASTLLVARDEARVVGTLTLAVFRIPSGVRAWIEDVVVDEGSRGRGTGEALTRRAIDIAWGKGAKTIELTSRPIREAANRLYRKLGFAMRETNVYRLERPRPAG